jgi:manganese/iron transport system permease protein
VLGALRVLFEPFQADYMRRALFAVLLLGVLGGVVGVAVQLRRLSFMAESLTHTVFPGVAIAFFLHGSLLLGALVAAVTSAIALTAISRLSTLDDDALLGLLLASFFAVGVIVVSRRPTFSSDLTQLLFGRVLTVSSRDLVETAIVTTVALTTLVALRKELILRAFDPQGARAVGYPTFALDLVLNVVVALVVVAAVRAVGTALVVAFVITPAATARRLSHHIAGMTAWSCGLACAAGWVGLGLSYDASVHHDVRLAAGATIVVLLTAVFIAVTGWVSVAEKLGKRRAAA